MEDTLRKLDELALELKLLTTEMREKGPMFLSWMKADERVNKIRTLMDSLAALNTTAAQGD